MVDINFIFDKEISEDYTVVEYNNMFSNTNSIIYQLFNNSLGNLISSPDNIPTTGGNKIFRGSLVVRQLFMHNNNASRGVNMVAMSATQWNSRTHTVPAGLHCYIVDSSKKYIIPIGVADSPSDWTNNFNHGIFKSLNNNYLRDLQNNKALLLIDQTLEGNHEKNLWEWFHIQCKLYKINPAAIIYMSGNQRISEEYDIWHQKHRPKFKIKTIPSIALSTVIKESYYSDKLNIIFENVLDYKKNNSTLISLYDCINFAPRSHRTINFLHLKYANLINDGKISMESLQKIPSWLTPTLSQLYLSGLPINYFKNNKNDPATWTMGDPSKIPFGNAVSRIQHDLYKNTWVSLIPETTYYDNYPAFISEKTFKPIACLQPFIILGSKGILKYLRTYGYKTFDGFIDESYDECDDDQRYMAIINSLKKIQSIPNKLEWYASMKDILKHNQQLLLNTFSMSLENEIIVNYYKNSYKEHNV